MTGIDNTVISPIEKTFIVVSGTNFGNDKNKLTAYLDSLDFSGKVVLVSKY